MKRGSRGALLFIVVVAVGGDLALWGGHVLWRDRALQRLSPMLEQIDSLEATISEDDTWISRNERLAQGYGRHRDYADRLVLLAQRARAHEVLVETYNRRVRSLYRRFYLAPARAPTPPFRETLSPGR
jgi:hypothetical protein